MGENRTGGRRRAAEICLSCARNIGSNGRKSTCNGLPQRVKLNGLLHFFMTWRRAPMPEASSETLPTVLVAGLNCSARLYADQIPALWQFGPVIVADHRRDDSMAAMARRILAAAPPRFALVGLSMGGYVAFEIMRQAASRVAKLALLDTGARGEAPERTEQRKPLIALAKSGRFARNFGLAISDPGAPQPPQRRGAQGNRARHERGDRRGRLPAPATGDHDAAGFASRPRARSNVRRWFWSATATRRRRRNWRARWRRQFPEQNSSSLPSAGTCRRSSGRKR